MFKTIVEITCNNYILSSMDIWLALRNFQPNSRFETKVIEQGEVEEKTEK